MREAMGNAITHVTPDMEAEVRRLANPDLATMDAWSKGEPGKSQMDIQRGGHTPKNPPPTTRSPGNGAVTILKQMQIPDGDKIVHDVAEPGGIETVPTADNTIAHKRSRNEIMNRKKEATKLSLEEFS